MYRYTVLEFFVGTSKPPPVPVTDRDSRTAAGMKRHPVELYKLN